MQSSIDLKYKKESILTSISHRIVLRVKLAAAAGWGIVLYRWGGHCCPMQCDLFKIYCAPPNLGITRT